MTTPIEGFSQVEPLIQPSYCVLQIDNTTQGMAIGQALVAAVSAGVISYGAPEIRSNPETGQVEWTIKITEPSGVDHFAGQGDYIVLTYHGENLARIELYNSPTGKYSNPPLSDRFAVGDDS